MGLLDKIFGGGAPSLKSVTFDVLGYEDRGVRENGHIWGLPETTGPIFHNGGVGLYYWPGTPALKAGLTSLDAVRQHYVEQMPDHFIVSVNLQCLDGVKSVELIAGLRTPGKHGIAFQGSFNILFRNFAFVVMVHCNELGITGLRETIITELTMRDGRSKIENGKFTQKPGWTYFDEEFDGKVPTHPLTRVRAELGKIASSLRIDSKIKGLPPFDLPID